MNDWNTKDHLLDHLRNSERWKKLRATILSNQPLCEVCRRMGRARPAEEVHHIIPARKLIMIRGEESFFDEGNLVGLCRVHHDRHENAWRNNQADLLFGKEPRL